MTSSIAGTYPQTAPVEDARPRRPVLRPLAEVLPDLTAPVTVPTPAPPAPSPSDSQAHVMAERVLRCAVEIVGGRRPAHQLTAVLHPALLDYLTGLHSAAGHLRPRVHTVHTQQPASGVLEAAAVVVFRTGVRALSARFERPRGTPNGRWRCTVLHVALTRGDLASHYRPASRGHR